MDPILEISGLKTYFFSKEGIIKAVNGVSFSVYPMETFGLVGESGCGKTVTCRSILKLIHQPGQIVGGSIRYKGRELLTMTDKEIHNIRGREIGMIFQEPLTALNPVLRIKEQIYESFDGEGMTKQQKYDRAIELLRLVRIPAPKVRIEQYPHQFSGGMRQRAMIAIVLAAEPKILLADEPTTSLDVTIQDQIIKLINSIKERLKMSVILVTHDLGVVAQMCDRVGVIYAGYMMELADTTTLFSKPRHPYTYGLLNSLPLVKERESKLEPIRGAPPDLGNLPPGCPFAPRCQFAGNKCTKVLPEIREIAQGHFSRCHNVDRMEDVRGIIEIKETFKG